MSDIRCPLHDMARIAPREPAWLEGNTAHLYPAMHVAAHTIARVLREEHGVGEGDRVVITSEPQWRWLPLLFALFRVGAVACPLNTRLPPRVLRERANFLSPTLQVGRGDANPLDGIPRVDLDSLCPSTSHGAVENEPVLLDLYRPATCVFTTGSMGRPRAVVHSLEAHYYSALGANRNLPLSQHDRWLLTLPLYHVGGLGVLFRCVMSAAAVISSPGPLANALEAHRVTRLSLVPTQLLRLLNDPRALASAKSLGSVLLGGGPIPRELVARALEAGIPVYATWGMTETASQVTTVSRFAGREERRESDGSVLPHREVRVDDTGEIHVRGHVLPLGQWDGERVAPLTSESGWLATGDLGRLENGVLTVVGRKDNQFVSGGENIQPEEIERALAEVSGAARVVVTPVPDPEFGMRPLAWLDAEPWEPESWEKKLRERLPGYMLPTAYRPLPPDAGLKPNRALLREMT